MSTVFASLMRNIRDRIFLPRDAKGRIHKVGPLRMTVPLICDGSGQVIFGADVGIGYLGAPMLGDGAVRIQARTPDSTITVGAGSFFSNNAQLIAENKISIGERCLIGDGVLILDSDFHDLSVEGRHSAPGRAAPVTLEDNVFLGSRVIILKGVTVGKDSVIGAGSVVARSIPKGVVAAGNPAKVIRYL